MPYVNIGRENSGSIKSLRGPRRRKTRVLIHGYPLSGTSWEKQVRALLQAGRRVITYDRRGRRSSNQPPVTITIRSPRT